MSLPVGHPHWNADLLISLAAQNDSPGGFRRWRNLILKASPLNPRLKVSSPGRLPTKAKCITFSQGLPHSQEAKAGGWFVINDSFFPLLGSLTKLLNALARQSVDIPKEHQPDSMVIIKLASFTFWGCSDLSLWSYYLSGPQDHKHFSKWPLIKIQWSWKPSREPRRKKLQLPPQGSLLNSPCTRERPSPGTRLRQQGRTDLSSYHMTGLPLPFFSLITRRERMGS